MDLEQLEKIGLTPKEAKVYTALLNLGDALVSEIANRTKINRSLLYSILETLEEKGIVTYIIKNNVRYYRAAEPNKILDHLKEKEKAFEEILPELINLYKPRFNKPIVEILEGLEGLKTIYNDVVRQKQEWFGYNVPGKGPEISGARAHSFEKERQQAKIPLKIIMINTPQSMKRGKEFAAMQYTQVKYMPESYESPASTWIYGDRVVLVFWYKEFPFAVRIIDKNLAESYKNYFRAIWDSNLTLPLEKE
ncbi:MAG: helix-turn-helix domain-containing protein [Candidatus ainarchaeum sp.]|nr:helix-turn-helix domain-containing protein [Candidatus ainarchaeum sp.]